MKATKWENNSNLDWLENTYWYCPTEYMPAIQTQSETSFEQVIDQTVWHITGCNNGYFWGVCSALITPKNQQPNPDNKEDMTIFGSITPDGQVHITFIHNALSTTIGTGQLSKHQNQQSFEMQMSTGPTFNMAVHWAFMMQISPDDPEWECLPGAGVSVEYMVGDIPAPSESMG